MLYQRIGQRDDHDDTYLFRMFLSPKIRGGRLMLHVFWRGDQDEHMHDHPWGFWTFPLVTYAEEYSPLGTTLVKTRMVDRFKWHFRPAKHRHRVLDPLGKLPIITLVWHKPKEREWGFWTDLADKWVPWREYVYPTKYLSEGEMLSDILANLSGEERSAILRIKNQTSMVRYHHSWGMWIRNHYKMWEPKNPHTKIDAEPNGAGILDDPLFPDQVSARLLERLWAEVHRGGV